MGQLTTVEAANWMALYLATGICCAMAFALSLGMMLCAVYRERSWPAVTSWQAALLFVPRTWWRWQKLSLTSLHVPHARSVERREGTECVSTFRFRGAPSHLNKSK